MIEDKKYVLKDTSSLIFGLTEFPPTVQSPEDDYAISNGMGIGMRVHMNDVDVDPVIMMDDKQAKVFIKALKTAIRDYRRYKRRIPKW